jgi:hypothetical protein
MAVLRALLIAFVRVIGFVSARIVLGYLMLRRPKDISMYFA